MFEKLITDFFMVCVYILQVIGGAPGEYGFGYYLANIIIFVIIVTICSPRSSQSTPAARGGTRRCWPSAW